MKGDEIKVINSANRYTVSADFGNYFFPSSVDLSEHPMPIVFQLASNSSSSALIETSIKMEYVTVTVLPSGSLFRQYDTYEEAVYFTLTLIK